MWPTNAAKHVGAPGRNIFNRRIAQGGKVEESVCSQYIFVAPPDYSALEPSRRRGYRIRTKDKQQYIVTRLVAADSLLIVQELKPDSDANMRPVPFTLPYSCDMPDPARQIHCDSNRCFRAS